MAKREKWYELVEDFCTAAQIHALLQPHKEAHKDEIRLTGTKEELIDVLKRAVAKKIVAFTDVIDLIREHEENGNQHIFYFVPASETPFHPCPHLYKLPDLLHPQRKSHF